MARGADAKLAFKFEIAFCIFIVALAFLWRQHPGLVYPQFLYCILTLLAVNLAAGIWLRMRPSNPFASALITLGNCVAITSVLAYSGGEHSSLWIIYALPIYMACLLLNPRSLIWVTAGVVMFNAVFHVYSMARMETAAMVVIVLKSGVLIFAASAGWFLMKRERGQALALSKHRARMQGLSDKMREMETTLKASERVADLGFLSFALARDLTTPLGAIVSTVKALKLGYSASDPVQADLERIMQSARLCAAMLKRFMLHIQEQKLELAPCDVEPLLRSALAGCDEEVRKSRAEVDVQIEEELPRIRASRQHLERALTNHIRRAAESMLNGGWLSIEARIAAGDDGGKRVEIVISDTGENVPIDEVNRTLSSLTEAAGLPTGSDLAIYLSKLIVRRHGGETYFSARAKGGTRVMISLPAAP